MNTEFNWKNKDSDNLFKGVLALESIEDCERFFRDLMTEQEIEVFTARFKTALMLDKKISYRKISKETGMSTATVTRVNNWLERGMGGYRLVIDKLKKEVLSNLFHHSSKPNLSAGL